MQQTGSHQSSNVGVIVKVLKRETLWKAVDSATVPKSDR